MTEINKLVDKLEDYDELIKENLGTCLIHSNERIREQAVRISKEEEEK